MQRKKNQSFAGKIGKNKRTKCNQTWWIGGYMELVQTGHSRSSCTLVAGGAAAATARWSLENWRWMWWEGRLSSSTIPSEVDTHSTQSFSILFLFFPFPSFKDPSFCARPRRQTPKRLHLYSSGGMWVCRCESSRRDNGNGIGEEDEVEEEEEEEEEGGWSLSCLVWLVWGYSGAREILRSATIWKRHYNGPLIREN